MQKKRSDAGKEIMMSMAVVVGSVFAIPVVISASPAIVSTVSTVVTNPSVQTFMYGGTSEYAGANMLANAIGQGVGNGGDVTKINFLEVAGSGFNGVAPLVISNTFNISISDISVNNETKKVAGIGTSLLGNGLINQLQLPKSLMTNASFATYQGMINCSIEATGTFTTNQITKK